MTGQASSTVEEIVGSSPAMARVRAMIAEAAATDAPMMLSGESGTGKDLVIRAIHAASFRAGQPLVTLNCSGVPDDILDRELHGPAGPWAPAPYAAAPRYLAQAGYGTLVLDDLCRAPPLLQGRLLQLAARRQIVTGDGLRVPFGARLIAASNIVPSVSLRQGRLRRDLYDSLAVLVIDLPPLRQRQSDAAEIAARLFPGLLGRFGHAPQPLPAVTLAGIGALDWPGNVRQLVNVLTRMALSPRPGLALPDDVPAAARFDPAPTEAPRTFAWIERQAILDAIARDDGSVQRAAEELGLAASTLYRKLKVWGRA